MTNDRNKFDTQYFMMCPKSIIYEYDLLTAALYGLIWSFSQMELGYCTLSQGQMAEKLGKKTRCINSKFKKLKDGKLIKIKRRERFPDGGVLLHVICNPEALRELDDKYLDKMSGKVD